MTITNAYAAISATSPLSLYPIERRDTGIHDVQIEILYCGICHSDVHQARNEWGGSKYPMVPGHEIVGKVTSVGAQVTKFKTGDLVGVGCFIDSCRTCHSCLTGEEQYCDQGMNSTYNSFEKDRVTLTQGGYSTGIVVDENYVLRISDKLHLPGVAPLLCAGITTYSPLRFWKVGPGKRVAVIGLGGLGHMGVKIASAMGAEVTVVSTHPAKEADARRMGAHHFVLSTDDAIMKTQRQHFDFILNTVSAKHDYNRFLHLLALNGTMVLVGVPPEAPPVAENILIGRRRTLAGSLIGGIRETQEMLEFCADHNIVSDVEIIPIQQVNEAYERLIKSDVKYRFVIDLASLKN